MGQLVFVLTHQKKLNFKTELLFYELKFCIQMFDLWSNVWNDSKMLYSGYLMERYLVTHPTAQKSSYLTRVF